MKKLKFFILPVIILSLLATACGLPFVGAADPIDGDDGIATTPSDPVYLYMVDIGTTTDQEAGIIVRVSNVALETSYVAASNSYLALPDENQTIFIVTDQEQLREWLVTNVTHVTKAEEILTRVNEDKSARFTVSEGVEIQFLDDDA